MHFLDTPVNFMEYRLIFSNMKSGVILYCSISDDEVAKMINGYEEFRREAVVESMANSPVLHGIC